MDTGGLKHYGRMNDPDGSAFVRGICGDTMEFYLVVRDGTVEEVRFHTDGCGHTLACGEAAAELVNGKTLDDAMAVSPARIREKAGGLPEDHTHCAILASLTLMKALADYLYRYYES
ncbi:MAG TPA: iron-sulfur cluster assembly scaffold protein [Spirochaetes bacterium]|nr:iron-sulfur cluster assembly scaffold protein [Spirochaetota bacterium]